MERDKRTPADDAHIDAKDQTSGQNAQESAAPAVGAMASDNRRGLGRSRFSVPAEPENTGRFAPAVRCLRRWLREMDEKSGDLHEAESDDPYEGDVLYARTKILDDVCWWLHDAGFKNAADALIESQDTIEMRLGQWERKKTLGEAPGAPVLDRSDERARSQTSSASTHAAESVEGLCPPTPGTTFDVEGFERAYGAWLTKPSTLRDAVVSMLAGIKMRRRERATEEGTKLRIDAEKASVADTDRRAATELRFRVSHLVHHQMWLAEAAYAFAKHRMFAIAVARGMASPWPPREVVDKLAEAVSHLLADHDCDAHGHELYRAAMLKAQSWLRGDPA